MARPRPQAARDEAALGVGGCPRDVRAWPFIRFNDTCVLVRLERVLLIIRGEFDGEVEECKRAEDVIGRAQSGGLFENGDVCRDREQEQDDILSDG